MSKSCLKKISVLCILILFGNVLIKMFGFYQKALEFERQQKERNQVMLSLFSKWIQNNNTGKSIEKYLNEMETKTIAIYGMGYAGWLLYDELKDTAIKVVFAIDRRKIATKDDLRIITVDDKFSDVDMIIVTAVSDFLEITDLLKGKTKSKVISLEQIIYEL